MPAISRRDNQDISIGGVALTATGLSGELSEPPPIEQFREAVAFIGRYGAATNWWIGDVAVLARTWGDDYHEALISMLGIEDDKLRDCVYVAEHVSFAVRTASLLWSHHKVVAPLTPTEQRYWLKRAQPKEGETKPRLSVAELRAAIRAKRLEKEQEEHPLPTGTYRVILADPPWKYSDELIDGYGAAEHHYPTLSIEELCSLHDATGRTVKDLAQPNAVLFLWTTSPTFREAFEVIDAWGFTYKAMFVWDKVRHNFGHYNSVRHELLLVCTSGNCVPDGGELFDSVVEIDRSQIHSQKPERFYEIIEAMYSEGPRLELFARGERDGWDSWGNEAKGKP